MIRSSLEVVLREPQIEEQPGVYVPQANSRLLMRAFAKHGPIAEADVLDVCCGSGVQGIAAAMRGHRVVAVDSEAEAMTATRRNAWLNNVELETCRGDLFEPVHGWRFDHVLANPPYVPTPPGAERTAWCDGGGDGRRLIDRICAEATSVLREGGTLWMVHSSLADIELSLMMLGMRGFKAEVVSEQRLAFGPVSRARIDHLVAGGHAQAGDTAERLAVIAATKVV